jgi:hypothetical protein
MIGNILYVEYKLNSSTSSTLVASCLLPRLLIEAQLIVYVLGHNVSLVIDSY